MNQKYLVSVFDKVNCWIREAINTRKMMQVCKQKREILPSSIHNYDKVFDI